MGQLDMPSNIRQRSQGAKKDFLSSDLFGHAPPQYNDADTSADLHAADVGEGFPNERKQNMLRSDLFGNTSPAASPGASRTDVFPNQGYTSGSTKEGAVDNVNQRKQDHLSSDVFGTGHAPVGTIGKTRSDVASSTFGRTEAHSNFESERTGERKRKFLTSDVFGNGHPTQFQEGGRPNTGDKPTGLAKEGNVTRGQGGAFDAVGGRVASSGRKKDHLKSDLFGREAHNTPARPISASDAAKTQYDPESDSKDRTHQMLQSDLFGRVTCNPNTGSQKRRTDIFPEPRVAGINDLTDNYMQRKATVLASDNLICGSGKPMDASAGDPTGNFTGGKGTAFKYVEDVKACAAYKGGSDKERQAAMLSSNLFGNATPASVAGKKRSDVGSSFARREAFHNFDTEFTGERKQKFLTSDVFNSNHPQKFQSGGRPNSSPNASNIVKAGPVGKGSSHMAHVGGRVASASRKNDQLKSDLFDRSIHDNAPPPSSSPNQTINKSGNINDDAGS